MSTHSEAIWEGAPASVLAVLSTARRVGATITRIKLAKLLYLADLRAVQSDTAAGSGLTWIWYHYGPYDRTLDSVERSLSDVSAIEVETVVNFYGSPEYRLAIRDAPQYQIDARFARIVEEVVTEYGRFSPTTLKDLTYQTPPMLIAQAKGRRNVRLDLSAQRPLPKVGSTLAKFRAISQRLPERTTSPEAMDELVADIEATRATRGRANQALLD
ncbi:type II toxin-antitoxin system antitoxin SocA domain-containing protein [Curtobacterium sp. MCLR17_054]|uniref:type II toxin-antitoxin system antitoxin SocA domain-containing protein n=1 Tax=Curtobacterium sp. MCLR17_054 TaxID=2175632 RepID=UPI000DAACEB4|nr:type II toxin-antitoxin system antitoxin SocA domain-containing protein [Curtobacterium sp. MCLR17_054]WIE69213.1 DUF4065 domain-containing protein [Curtobacterium sp. MCLR17_054]